MVRKSLPRRVNSADPAHRRRIARQNAGRSKPVKFGEIRGSRYVTDKKGRRRYLNYEPLIRRNAKGKAVSYTSGNKVWAYLPGGKRRRVEARDVVKGIRSGKYVLRELKSARRR